MKETPVIDPSEIIVDWNGTIKEETTKANPWIRFFARFFDYALFFSILWCLRKWVFSFSLRQYEWMVPIEFLIYIPIESFLLTSWGTTPGKWFLKVELRPKARRKFDFLSATKRSLLVWFRGLGMWIPIINFLCLLNAYHRLNIFQKTSWDKELGVTVIHKPVGRWRYICAACLSIFGIILFHTKEV